MKPRRGPATVQVKVCLFKCKDAFPGEDALTLARRVVDAYVKMLSNSSVDSTNVWDVVVYTDAINDRYESCLLNDESDAARGAKSSRKFTKELFLRRGRVQRGQDGRSVLSCIVIAETVLLPLEGSRAHSNDIANLSDLGGLDDSASEASASSATHRPRGRGHRERRAAARLALQRQ